MRHLLAMLIAVLPGCLCAATFTVTNLNDSGAGSLRQAMIDAEANGASDTIVFQSGLTGTITLASQLPSVSTTMIINNGNPQDIEVSGNNAGLVFACGSGATLDIRGLTISNGLSSTTGCAIYASAGAGSAILRLDRCIVRDSSAGSGAGVYMLAGSTGTCTATITSCMFTGNTAGSLGGAVAAQGTGPVDLTCTNCTFSGNDTAGQGGAVYYASPGTCNLVNCTLTENQAGTGGAVNRAGGTMNLAGCIVAENLGPVGSPDGSGSFTSLGGNLIGDATGMTITATTGDQFGAAATPIDPMLLALADNFGPTPTHALLNSSPAVDAGNSVSAPSDDQRGFPRVDLPDCGAFELQPPQLEVSQAASIANGATIYLTGTSAPGAGRDVTFTVQNLGFAGEKNLLITMVFTSGTGNCAAAVTTAPATSVVPGASTSMVITITPTAAGLYYVDLYVESNDPNMLFYQITLIGFASQGASSGGGDNGDDSSCSTGDRASPWLLLAGLAASLLVTLRLARRGPQACTRARA